MFIRRTFYYWQFIAVIVLPLWLLIGSSIFGSGGWAALGAIFSTVLIGVGLLAVSLLFYARKEVRTTKAVSWADVGVLTIWHALIVGVGFSIGSGAVSVLATLVGLGAFWFAIWELFDAARRRVREVIDLIDETARTGSPPPAAVPTGRPGSSSGRAVDPEVIVIREKPTGP